MTDLGFIHRFIPASLPGKPTLLLLHGTGGDENDLIPLGEQLSPGSALLSPRGKMLENGMPRFFRRLAEGVFDLDDLKARTRELAALLLSGAADPMIQPASRDWLARVLSLAGAKVTHEIISGGHNLTQRDMALAAQWLQDLG